MLECRKGQGKIRIMKGVLRMVRLEPNDTVYMIFNIKSKIVVKMKVKKILIQENLIEYTCIGGKIMCSKSENKLYKAGNYLSITAFFKNSNIDTGVEENGLLIFTTKEKCIEFLKGR